MKCHFNGIVAEGPGERQLICFLTNTDFIRINVFGCSSWFIFSFSCLLFIVVSFSVTFPDIPRWRQLPTSIYLTWHWLMRWFWLRFPSRAQMCSLVSGPLAMPCARQSSPSTTITCSPVCSPWLWWAWIDTWPCATQWKLWTCGRPTRPRWSISACGS